MKLSTAFFWAAVIQLTLGELARADEPAPGAFAIQSFAFFGDGCRPGSVASNVAPDNKAFTLIFNAFVVESTASARQAKKSCELDLKLKVPSGWSVGVATADVRGYAALSDAMAFGNVNSVYAVRGSRNPTSLMRQRFVGPYDSTYQLRNEAQVSTVNFTACGKTRVLRLKTTIRTRLSPQAQNQGALMTVDSLDGQVTQKYGLVWKRCARPEDPEETGAFPDLAINYTGVCKAIMKNRQGQTVGMYEGSAVGSDERAALRGAEADAKQQCRADRRATPQSVCELVAGSCVATKD